MPAPKISRLNIDVDFDRARLDHPESMVVTVSGAPDEATKIAMEKALDPLIRKGVTSALAAVAQLGAGGSTEGTKRKDREDVGASESDAALKEAWFQKPGACQALSCAFPLLATAFRSDARLEFIQFRFPPTCKAPEIWLGLSDPADEERDEEMEEIALPEYMPCKGFSDDGIRKLGMDLIQSMGLRQQGVGGYETIHRAMVLGEGA